MREQVAGGQAETGRSSLSVGSRGSQIALKIYEKSPKSLGAAQMGVRHVAPLSFELHALARLRCELVRGERANNTMTTMKPGAR